MNASGDDLALLELNDQLLTDSHPGLEPQDGGFPQDSESRLLKRLSASDDEFARTITVADLDDDRVSRTRAKRGRKLRRILRRVVGVKMKARVPDTDRMGPAEPTLDVQPVILQARSVSRKAVQGATPHRRVAPEVPAVQRKRDMSEIRPKKQVPKRVAQGSGVSRKGRKPAKKPPKIETTVQPAPEPRPLKVIRRRKAEEPKVFVTQPKSIPDAMMEGITKEKDEPNSNNSE
jgi:hypothetical protein